MMLHFTKKYKKNAQINKHRQRFPAAAGHDAAREVRRPTLSGSTAAGSGQSRWVGPADYYRLTAIGFSEAVAMEATECGRLYHLRRLAQDCCRPESRRNDFRGRRSDGHRTGRYGCCHGEVLQHTERLLEALANGGWTSITAPDMVVAQVQAVIRAGESALNAQLGERAEAA
jgi:hypothetical protein